MKRRNFIRNALGATVFGLGGTAAYQFYRQSNIKLSLQDNFNYQFLNDNDLIVLQVIVPVFLSSELSRDISDETVKSAHKDKNSYAVMPAVNTAIVIQNIDSAIPLLSQATQQELRELLDLLASIAGRLLVARVWLDWQSATRNSIDEFLNEWRESSLALLQVAYRGLHKLIIGSYYAEVSTWSTIGYAGPPQFALNFSSQLSSSETNKVAKRQPINNNPQTVFEPDREVSR